MQIVSVDWEKGTMFFPPEDIKTYEHLGTPAPDYDTYKERGDANLWPRDLSPPHTPEKSPDLYREAGSLWGILSELNERGGSWRIIIEASYLSYKGGFDPELKNNFIRLCRKDGHVIHPQHTRHIRKVRGYPGFNFGDARREYDEDEEKWKWRGGNRKGKGDDFRDAFCIFHVMCVYRGSDPRTWPTAKIVGEDELVMRERADQARRETVAIRASPGNAKKLVKQRFHEVASTKRVYHYEKDCIEDMISEGALSVLIAARAACDVEDTKSAAKKKMEKMIGPYDFGFKNIFRSDYMRRLNYLKKTSDDPGDVPRKLKNAYRWCFHFVWDIVHGDYSKWVQPYYVPEGREAEDPLAWVLATEEHRPFYPPASVPEMLRPEDVHVSADTPIMRDFVSAEEIKRKVQERKKESRKRNPDGLAACPDTVLAKIRAET